MGLQLGEKGAKAVFKNKWPTAWRYYPRLQDAQRATGTDRASTVAIIDGNIVVRNVPTQLTRFEDYVHFTSPIRRYPDLLVHRAIKRALAKKHRERSKKMVELGAHLSMTERRADDASRDVEQWLKCEYMRDKVGESFNGVISGVAGFGLFVELTEVFVEGLISVRDLKEDYFNFDDIHHQLKGQRGGRIYRLGDLISVKVASVNLDDRKIEFVPT